MDYKLVRSIAQHRRREHEREERYGSHHTTHASVLNVSQITPTSTISQVTPMLGTDGGSSFMLHLATNT